MTEEQLFGHELAASVIESRMAERVIALVAEVRRLHREIEQLRQQKPRRSRKEV